MIGKTSTAQPLLIRKKQGFLFVVQCLIGGAVIGAVAGFATTKTFAEPALEKLAAVQTGAETGGGVTQAIKSVSLQEILRLAQAQHFGTGSAGNYLAGRYAANSGDFENAKRYLTRTMRLDPKNMEIAGYTYRMRLITGDMEGAADLAKMLYENGDVESNPEIMVLLSHIKSGDYENARTVLKGFRNDGFNAIILPLITAWLDYAEGKLTAAVKQDAAIKRAAEFAPFIYYQSALLNDLAGFEDVALMQYNEALALSSAMPYRVVEILGNLYARRGEWAKAEELFARYRADNPDSLLLASDEHVLGQRTTAPSRLVKSPREGVAEILFSTASILHTEALNEEALIYIQQVLYLSPDFTAARLMRGTIYEDLRRYDAAMAEYDSLPTTSPYYYKGQLRKAYTLNAMERNEDALKLLSRLEGTVANDYQLQLTRGDILMRVERFADAAKAYEHALRDVAHYRVEHWPVLYARGICYERSGEWEKAEKDFLTALELQPGQPDVLNYLGYSWLTQNTRIKEAGKMIEQAVRARPSDAHIVDSMGWALYLQGDYAGAIAYLEKAIELMPTDPTVNDHLGDAYWQAGRKTEARFQWRRALTFNPNPEHAETLSQKLADGLPMANDEGVKAAEIDKKQHVELR